MTALLLRQACSLIDIDLYTLTIVNILISLQLVVVVAYTVLTEVTVPGLRYFIIPFIWINVAGWAIIRVDTPARGIEHTAVAFGIAAAYFLVMLYLSGLLRPSAASLKQITGAAGFGITWRSLGWGPTLVYSGEWFNLVLVPYQVIGYLALSYLLYVTLLEIRGSALGGIVGLAPCPGCAAPLFMSLIAGVAGTSSAAVFLLSYQYELATMLFLIAIAILSR